VHHLERKTGFIYELVYDGGGKSGEQFVPGLIDVSSLGGAEQDERWSALLGQWSGQKEQRSGSGRPEVGAESGHGRGLEKVVSAHTLGRNQESQLKTPKKAHMGVSLEPITYISLSPKGDKFRLSGRFTPHNSALAAAGAAGRESVALSGETCARTELLR